MTTKDSLDPLEWIFEKNGFSKANKWRRGTWMATCFEIISKDEHL